MKQKRGRAKVSVFDFNHLTIELTKRLNEIAEEKRASYMEFVDDCMKKSNRADTFGWLSGFASRNSSYVYTNVYKLLLLSELLGERNVDRVVVYDSFQKKAVQALCRQSGCKVKICQTRKTIKDSALIREFQFFYVLAGKYRESRRIRRVIKPEGKKLRTPFFLFDTYVLNSSFTESGYKDRYFTNILEYTKENILFSTILTNNLQESGTSFYTKIKEEKKYQFLVKESFLTLKDYIWMLRWRKVNESFLHGNYVFAGCDISALVRGDILQGFAYPNTIDGLIAYRFLKRIKEKGGTIKKAVLWYEGQPSSIGFVLGMRRFFPEVLVTGYVGLPLLENEICYYPSREQQKQKVLPYTFGVIGRGYTELIKKYNTGLKVEVYPAFRYPSLWRKREEKENGGQKSILLVLSYYVDISASLIRETLKALECTGGTSYQIYMKNHPVNARMSLKDYSVQTDREIFLVEGDLIEAVQGKDIVIATATTSGMEIISQGAKLILYTAAGELINNAIPETIGKDYYATAYSSEEIAECIHAFENVATGTDIYLLDEYFERVEKETVCKIFN